MKTQNLPTAYGDLLVDQQKYSHFAELADEFKKQHYAVLRSFMLPRGVRLLQDEIRRLRENSVRKQFLMECMDDSPRRMSTVGGPVVDRLSSLIPGIYRDPYLLDMISAVYGERVLPLEADVDRYVVNILSANSDTFGAHFDDYPISVVLIVEAPDPQLGGCPELAPRASSLSDLETDARQTLELAAGDIYLLKSDTTAHRVSPLRADVDRIAINLAYTTPGYTVDETPSAALLYSREPVTAAGTAESHNEWDPLEEVIVGIAEGALFPAEDRRVIEATMPPEHWDLFDGRAFPAEIVAAAAAELDNLAAVLEGLDITVRRPAPVDWRELGGHSATMPRDSLLLVGSTFIEAPMAWRSRQSETLAFRSLLREYQASGSGWISAPRTRPSAVPDDAPWAVSDGQPAFDAADFLRFGRDIIGQLSHVTNAAGIAWLRRHLGEEYRVHTLAHDDPHAMHIDASIMPLREGLLLANPERVDTSALARTLFSRWEIVPAPRPAPRTWPPLYMTSGWINMNLLALDAERILVEERDEAMYALLESLGFTPIPCPFQHVQSLGGSFHCATLDVRRRGVLESHL